MRCRDCLVVVVGLVLALLGTPARGDAPWMPPDPPPPIAHQLDDTHYEISAEQRDAFMHDAGKACGCRLVPVIKDKVPVGYKIYAIRKAALAGALGLKNGDTIVKVNDIAAQSLERHDVAGGTTFELLLERQGKPLTIVVYVK
jgi:type II secretory pathway component PulC